MKVGIIAPIKFLEEYCITDIQYCLPTLIVNEPEYRKFYIDRRRKGDTIILDCKKVSQKREPEDFQTVSEAIKILNPQITVLPSCMFKVEETVAMASYYMGLLASNKYKNEVVPCLEGTTPEEVEYCLEALRYCVHYALPSHLYPTVLKHSMERDPLLYLDNRRAPNELEGRSGILVTSLPVRLGLQGRSLSSYMPSPPLLAYHETLNPFPDLTRKNIREVVNFYDA